MAEEIQGDIWPLPKFYFAVRFLSQNIEASFQEISGADVDSDIIEYRHSESELFSTVKIPGIQKAQNVILKNGIFKKVDFQNWSKAIKDNVITRETVIIKLFDETNTPIMTWTLSNVWPTKITTTDFNDNINDIAVETLELSHEGITIENQL